MNLLFLFFLYQTKTIKKKINIIQIRIHIYSYILLNNLNSGYLMGNLKYFDKTNVLHE